MADQPVPGKETARLGYLTAALAGVTGIISVAYGAEAASIALLGFGLAMLAESLSELLLILLVVGRMDASCGEKTMGRAARFLSALFFLIGLVVLYESVNALATGVRVRPSPAGIMIASVTLIILPVIAWRRKLAGMAFGSRALVADAKGIVAPALLPAVTLLGLLTIQLSGAGLADPLAGLAIALLLFHEGYRIWCLSCGGWECPGS
ncbi:MAG: cation transporter [Methanoregula sp.]|nr:cation transporter [Methanoregula sp.]